MFAATPSASPARSWGAGPRPRCDKPYLAAQPSAGTPPLTIRWGTCQGRSRTPWLSLWPGRNSIYRDPDPLSSRCTSLPPWPGEGKQTRRSVTAPGPVVLVPGRHTRSRLSDVGTFVSRPLSTLGTAPTRNGQGRERNALSPRTYRCFRRLPSC